MKIPAAVLLLLSLPAAAAPQKVDGNPPFRLRAGAGLAAPEGPGLPLGGPALRMDLEAAPFSFLTLGIRLGAERFFLEEESTGRRTTVDLGETSAALRVALPGPFPRPYVTAAAGAFRANGRGEGPQPFAKGVLWSGALGFEFRIGGAWRAWTEIERGWRRDHRGGEEIQGTRTLLGAELRFR